MLLKSLWIQETSEEEKNGEKNVQKKDTITCLTKANKKKENIGNSKYFSRRIVKGAKTNNRTNK